MARRRLDLPRIAADQPGGDLLVQDRFDRLRAAEGLAQAGQPLVGFDLHPDQVGAFGDPDGTQGGDAGHEAS